MRELNGRSGPFREGLGSHPEGGMIELKPEGRAGNKEVRGPWEPREDLPERVKALATGNMAFPDARGQWTRVREVRGRNARDGQEG